MEWDRQPNEPTRWYSRFELYRAGGPGRSLLAVYAGQAPKGPKRPDSIPAAWKRAAVAWRWRERAAAWDQSMIATSLAAWEAEYQAALVAHRDHALELAGRAFRVALDLLRALTIRLEDFTPEDIEPQHIPALMRAAAAVAEAALNSEAQALAVDELLARIDGDWTPHGSGVMAGHPMVDRKPHALPAPAGTPMQSVIP